MPLLLVSYLSEEGQAALCSRNGAPCGARLQQVTVSYDRSSCRNQCVPVHIGITYMPVGLRLTRSCGRVEQFTVCSCQVNGIMWIAVQGMPLSVATVAG